MRGRKKKSPPGSESSFFYERLSTDRLQLKLTASAITPTERETSANESFIRSREFPDEKGGKKAPRGFAVEHPLRLSPLSERRQTLLSLSPSPAVL